MREKIKNLEFLRIIGCIAIVLLHLFNQATFYTLFPDIEIYNKFRQMTANGQIAVDLFFILSGFFFIYNYTSGKTAAEFIKKKIIRLYPVLIFIIILYFAASLTGVLKFKYYDNLLTIFCLNGIGLTLKYDNVCVFWYCSAMLWVMLFYKCLIDSYNYKTVNLIIAVISIFAYIFVIHVHNGSIYGHFDTYYAFFNIGIMRAVAGMGVGYFIGGWYKNNLISIKNLKFNLFQKILISFTEFICIYFIINNLIFHKLKFQNKIIFIAVFTITIILFLIKQGIFSKLLDNKLCIVFSKYTYSVYMVHLFIYQVLKGSIWKYYPEFVYVYPIVNIIIPLFLTIILGAVTYHFIEIPFARLLNNYKFSNITPRAGGD